MKRTITVFFILIVHLLKAQELNFTPLSSIPTSLSGTSSSVNNADIYLCNGWNLGDQNNVQFLSSIFKYNTVDDIWSQLNISGVSPKRYASSEIINNKLYIFNGTAFYNNTTGGNNRVEIIDLSDNSLTYGTLNPKLRKVAGSAVSNGIIYTFGGKNFEDANYENSLYAYNTENDTWTQLAPMPEAKETKGKIVDGKLYVIGGYNGAVSNRIDIYNIETNEWENQFTMPNAISAHSLAAIGSKIFILGDYVNSDYTAYFDTTTYEFVELNSNMTGRRHSSTEIVGNEIYVMAGNVTSSGSSILDVIEKVNIEEIATKEDLIFDFLNNIPTALSAASSASNNSDIYVCNGWNLDEDNNLQILNSIYKFNSEENDWSEINIAGTIPKRYGSSEIINNKLYILNGSTTRNNELIGNKKVEIINLSDNSLAFGTVNPIPRVNPGSAVHNDVIYNFGGFNKDEEIYENTLYAYDTANDTWKQLAPMPEAKETRGKVIDGKLYVVGGYNGSVSNRIDIYDIANNIWQGHFTMPVSVSAHSLAVVDSKIYIFGDYGNLDYTAYFDTNTYRFVELTNNMFGRRHSTAQAIGDEIFVIAGNVTSSGTSVLNAIEKTNVSTFKAYNHESIRSNSTANFEETDVLNKIDGEVLAKKNIIFPNPFNEHITFKSKENYEFEYVIYDNLGKVIKKGNSTTNEKISVEELLESEKYYFTIIKEGVKSTFKLIK